jgi:ABC-type glutathione transport system ATPase component
MVVEAQHVGPSAGALLSVRELTLEYAQRRVFATERTETLALRDVSFDLESGKTLVLVGPSGSGKSSLARCLVLLERPRQGKILYKGKDLMSLGRKALKSVRSEIHLIFQDSGLSLNPRFTVGELIIEPLLIHKVLGSQEEIDKRVRVALDQVELGQGFLGRRPSELSGGQRQRVAIARAIVLRPTLLILDEALSSLDLSTQGQIANLLLDLQEQYSLAYLYVTHDLRLARALAHEVAEIRDGRIVRQDMPSIVLTANLQPVS